MVRKKEKRKMKEVGQREKGKGKRQKDEGRIKQTKGEGQEKLLTLSRIKRGVKIKQTINKEQ